MSEKIQFQTNVPIGLALRFLEGKPVDSQFGPPQHLFSTTDDRVFFVKEPEGASISGQLRDLGIRPGEEIEIGRMERRQGNRKWIEFEVKRVHPPAATNGNGANGHHPPAPPAPAISQPAPLDRQQSNGSAPPNGQPNGQPNGHGNGHAATEAYELSHSGWAASIRTATQARLEVYQDLCKWAAERFGGAVSKQEVSSFMMNVLISHDKQGGQR